MGTTDYNVSNGEDRTSVNGTVNTAGLTNETYNINLDGLKNDDSDGVLDGDAVKKLLDGIDAGDSNDADKISRYTSVKQSGNLATDISYQGEKVYAYDLTKKSGNSDNTGSRQRTSRKSTATASMWAARTSAAPSHWRPMSRRMIAVKSPPSNMQIRPIRLMASMC